MTINKCNRVDCNPLFQIRGEMKPENHHEQFRRAEAAKIFATEHGVSLAVNNFKDDAHNVEDMGAEHNSDIRISCSVCGKSIGWDRPDKEEFRRHDAGDYRRHVLIRDGNKDNVINRWNEMVK